MNNYKLKIQSRFFHLQSLQFVQIISKVRVTGFQSLPLLGVLNNGVGLGVLLHWVSRQDLPVVKHALRESLAASVGSQVSGEAERLVDGQVGLHHEHGSAGGLSLLEHMTSPSVEHTVDTSHSVLWALREKYVSINHHECL